MWAHAGALRKALPGCQFTLHQCMISRHESLGARDWLLLVISLPTRADGADADLACAQGARLRRLAGRRLLLPAGAERERGAAGAGRRVHSRRRERVADDVQARPAKTKLDVPAAVRSFRADTRSFGAWKRRQPGACQAAPRRNSPDCSEALQREIDAFMRSTSSRRRRASRPKRPGPTSSSASMACSRPTSRTRLRRIPRLDPAEYRGRTWATRRRLWVDRVASAWLIRRFIDPEARFRWLAKPSDCPKSRARLRLRRRDLHPRRRSRHFRDAAGELRPRRGPGARSPRHDRPCARRRWRPGTRSQRLRGRHGRNARALEDDDALLAEMSTVLDSLYAHFPREAQRGARTDGLQSMNAPPNRRVVAPPYRRALLTRCGNWWATRWAWAPGASADRSH